MEQETNAAIDAAQGGIVAQDKLLSAEIAVVGAEPITHFLGAALGCMGFGRNRLFYDTPASTSRKAEGNWNRFLYAFGGSIEQVLAEVAQNGVSFRKYNSPQKDTELMVAYSARQNGGGFENKPSAVVDASNNPQTKLVAFKYCLQKGVRFLSASADDTSFVITGYEPKTSKMRISNGRAVNVSPEDILRFRHEQYAGKEQGAAVSSLCAAIIAEELAKIAVDDPAAGALLKHMHYSMLSEERTGKSSGITLAARGKPATVAIIGAGGLGTFAGLCLALEARKMPLKIIIIDYDHIEPHNLNRQFLYAWNVGRAPDGRYYKKAKVMAEKLSKINSGVEIAGINGIVMDEDIQGLPEQRDINNEPVKMIFGSWFKENAVDAIVGCLDKAVPRDILSRVAEKYSIPYIDAGCGTQNIENSRAVRSNSDITVYVPQKSPTINVVRDMELHARDEKRMNRQGYQIVSREYHPCSANPTFLPPNAVGGTIEAIESILLLFSKQYVPIKGDYRSDSEPRLWFERSQFRDIQRERREARTEAAKIMALLAKPGEQIVTG